MSQPVKTRIPKFLELSLKDSTLKMAVCQLPFRIKHTQVPRYLTRNYGHLHL
jgi:hypothetical protein